MLWNDFPLWPRSSFYLHCSTMGTGMVQKPLENLLWIKTPPAPLFPGRKLWHGRDWATVSSNVQGTCKALLTLSAPCWLISLKSMYSNWSIAGLTLLNSYHRLWLTEVKTKLCLCNFNQLLEQILSLVFDNANPFKGFLGIASCLLSKSSYLANEFLYEVGRRKSSSMNEMVFSSKANRR